MAARPGLPALRGLGHNRLPVRRAGEWEESGVTYTAGTLFHAPKGVQHGPHVAKTEVISLTVFDGPLTVA